MRVLGVDGGQSGIRLRHSGDGATIEVGGVSRLEGDTDALVVDAVARGWTRTSRTRVDRVVLGLTTAPVDDAVRDRLCLGVSQVTDAAEVWLADDAVTSHAGALSLGWGICLVAGTGVGCLVAPQDGPARIVGGHGYLLGDEGGGFWIGRHGLAAVLRAGDGRAPATALTDAAAATFGSLDGLHVRLHSADRPVNTIAQFATQVLAVAAAGDGVADRIMTAAANELYALVRAGTAMGTADEAMPLGLGGRLLAPGTALRSRLDAVIASGEIPVRPRTADGSALDGAVSIGLSGRTGPYDGLIHIWTRGAVA